MTTRALLGATIVAAVFMGSPSSEPSRAQDGVRVERTGGGPCPPVAAPRKGLVRGGCSAKGSASFFDSKMSVRTMFGSMPFGDCGMDGRFTLAADGRLWVDRVVLGGPPPCADVRPCAPREALAKRKGGVGPAPPELVPAWRGRVSPDTSAGARVRLAVCIETCLGRYAGTVEGRLSPTAGGSRMTIRSGVGTTGWRLDMTVEIPKLQIVVR
jgi:hypothetical protein